MHPLDKQSLCQIFDDAKKESAFDANLAQLVKDLSQCLADLQQIGTDVSLDISPCCGEYHFALFNNATISLAGMLTIGNQDHLFAIATKAESASGVEKECLYIGLSQQNMRYNVPNAAVIGNRNIIPTIRRYIIDAAHPDGIIEFQKFVIKKAAEQESLKELDTHQSFKPRQTELTFFKKDFRL